MNLEIDETQKEHLTAILTRQVKKTTWVLENRDVDNREQLEERVDVMKDLLNKLGDKEDASV